MFKSPRRLDDCRICGTLETMGETNLYVDHISESVIGCPKFQAMSTDDEKTSAFKAFKARLCIRCCDNNVLYDPHHNRN